MDVLHNKAKKIKLLLLDVDGVLTDGSVWYSDSGAELKPFNIKDGLGIKMLQQGDIATGIITGRNSPIVERRAQELGINWVTQGKVYKVPAFEDLCSKAGVLPEEVAYMGDDLPDLPIIQKVGLSMTVADAHYEVIRGADWQSIYAGGHGAVREAAEFILAAQGKLSNIFKHYHS